MIRWNIRLLLFQSATSIATNKKKNKFSFVLLVAQKRNDVHWYPSAKWYKDDENALKQGIENLGNAYRSLQTEYDRVFGE